MQYNLTTADIAPTLTLMKLCLNDETLIWGQVTITLIINRPRHYRGIKPVIDRQRRDLAYSEAIEFLEKCVTELKEEYARH